MAFAKRQLRFPLVSQARSPWFLGLLFLAALVFYLSLAWFYLRPEALWSPDEGAKFLQMESLRWEDGRPAYDIIYPGRSIDPGLRYAISFSDRSLFHVRDGRLYFGRLPIFPLLTLPLFRAFGSWGLYVLPALAGALIGVLALSMLEPQDRLTGIWLLVALGSPVAIYSTIFWEHTLAVSLVLAGACLVFWLPAINWLRPWQAAAGWAVAGLLMCAGVYLRQETIIFAGAFLGSAWLLMADRRQGVFVSALALGAGLLPYPFLHGYLFSGAPVPDNARYLFYPFAYLRSTGWQAIPDLLVGPAQDEAIAPGLLGAAWAMAAVLAFGFSLLPRRWRVAGYLRQLCLAGSAVVAAAFLFTQAPYRSAHGLLFTTPWAIVGLCGMPDIWRTGKARWRVLVLTAAVGLLGYILGLVFLRASSPHGGLEWGARFAMIFYIPLAIITILYQRLSRSAVENGILLALILLGVGFQARGLWTIHQDKISSLTLARTLQELPESAILTDVWWLLYDSAPVAGQKAIFTASNTLDIADWVNLVHAQQMQDFILVTFTPQQVAEVNRLLERLNLETRRSILLGGVSVLQIRITSR